MNLAIKIIENEIRNYTSGYNVAEVIEVSGDQIIVNYKQRKLFGYFSGPVKIGQFYSVLNVFCSSEHEKLNHMISLGANELNCVELGENLVSETLQAVYELTTAARRLSSPENTFTQKLPEGKLIAYPHADYHYPGIAIDVIPNNDGVLENAVLVEFNDEEGIVVHVWEQDTEDSVYRKVWTKK